MLKQFVQNESKTAMTRVKVVEGSFDSQEGQPTSSWRSYEESDNTVNTDEKACEAIFKKKKKNVPYKYYLQGKNKEKHA